MKIDDNPQYTFPFWLARRGVPSASNADRIITPAKGDYSKSATDYAYDLIAERFDPGYGLYEETATRAMQHGIFTEPEARSYYELDRNCDVQQVGFCTTDDGRFGCSPDGLVGDDGGIELKCPQLSTHVAYLIDGCLPNKYKPQVHMSLYVSGRAFWDFMSYAAGLPPLIVRVTPDDYTKRLGEHLETFWIEYQTILSRVMEKLPPPPAPIVTDYGMFGTVVTSATAIESPF